MILMSRRCCSPGGSTDAAPGRIPRERGPRDAADEHCPALPRLAWSAGRFQTPSSRSAILGNFGLQTWIMRRFSLFAWRGAGGVSEHDVVAFAQHSTQHAESVWALTSLWTNDGAAGWRERPEQLVVVRETDATLCA